MTGFGISGQQTTLHRYKQKEFAGGGWERRPQRRGTTGGQDEPTGRRRKDGTRQGGRVRTVRRPQGVTRAPRPAGRGGSRTPGLLRGGRPPLNASACTGNLKLPLAWRAKPAQRKPLPLSRSEFPSPGGQNPLRSVHHHHIGHQIFTSLFILFGINPLQLR